MKIAFNPSTVAALTSPPDNKDITFDLAGRNIFVRGVKFFGTDTQVNIIDNLNSSDSKSALSANMGRYLNLTKTPYNNTSTPSSAPSAYNIEICPTSSSWYSSLGIPDGGGGLLIRGHTGTAFNLWLHDTSNVWYKQTASGAWKKMDAGNADTVGGYSETNFFRYRGNIDVNYIDLTTYTTNATGYQNPLNGVYKVSRTNDSEMFISFSGSGATSGLELYTKYSASSPIKFRHRIDSNRIDGAWRTLIDSSSIGSQTVASASKLTTARSIWGQSFDGSKDISGDMRNVGTLYFSNTTEAHIGYNNTYTDPYVNLSVNFKLGGTVAAKTIYSNGGFVKSGSSNDYVLLGGGSHSKISSLSVGNADTVDGYHASKYLMTSYTIDASNLDTDTYYPVVMNLSPTNNTRIEIEVALNSGTKPAWATHSSGFSVRKIWESNGNGYGTINITRRILVSTYGWATSDPVRGIGQLSNGNKEYVYVRGGGKYFFKVSIGGGAPTLCSNTYEVYNQSVSPTTTAPKEITTDFNNYVLKTGDSMSGKLSIATGSFGALVIQRNDDSNGASIQFRGNTNIYGYIGFNNSARDKQLQRWNSAANTVYTILDTSSTRISDSVITINGTSITVSKSDHNHDGRYVRYYTVTSLDCNNLANGFTAARATASNAANSNHSAFLYVSDVGTPFQLQFPDSSNFYVYKRYKSSGSWSAWAKLSAGYADHAGYLDKTFTVFGVEYNGSQTKSVIPSNFVSQLSEGTSTVTDGTMLITSYASNNGFADSNAVNIPYKRKAIHLWEYIANKADVRYTRYYNNHDLNIDSFTDQNYIQTAASQGGGWTGTSPSGSHNGKAVLNAHTYTGNYYSQLMLDTAQNRLWMRSANNTTTYGNWFKIAYVSDIPTKDSWNYDDRYLKLTGGTMAGTAYITWADSGSWSAGTGAQGARGGLKWSGQSDYAWLYAEETAGDNLDLVIKFGDDNSNGLSIRNVSNVQTTYISANGIISTGTFKGNLDWSYITSKPSFYTKAESDAKYVTSLGTSGRNLTWTKNGTTNNITVPFATYSSALKSTGDDGNWYNWVYWNGSYFWLKAGTSIYNNNTATLKTAVDYSTMSSYLIDNGTHSETASGTTANAANAGMLYGSGMYMTRTYHDSSMPTSYGNVINVAGGGSGQLLLGWSGSDSTTGNIYYRSHRDTATGGWGSWVTLLATNNYAGILDSRYYTESEVNNLLSKKLDRVNLTTGSWNPRGYNLAADYHYNGGDVSFAESGGQMHISIDGKFWQNEGQYRVLDTSDLNGVYNTLTINQYLSTTDTTWWPLIWGGSSHNNTNNSTGAVYKSYSALTWQTSSQTLYATMMRTNRLDVNGTPSSTSYRVADIAEFRSNYSSGIGWSVALKNTYHTSSSTGFGVGLKLALGADSETFKWVGIAAVSTSAWENAQDMLFYTSTTEKMRLTSDGHLSLKQGDLLFSNVTSGLCNGVQWTCGDNDYARIKAGATSSNNGYLEIATADDGNEPVYVRQYTGAFSSVKRTLTLLDANGFSYFPSYINIGGNENNNSSPDRVWGSNGSDSFLRSYRTSALSVAYSKYLSGISLTGGNGNNEGYRLIFQKTMGGWTINYGVWAIAFRHSGRGTLSIGFDTTNSNGSSYTYDIRFFGSIASKESTPFRAFYNTTTKVLRIYWHYYDYTSGEISILRGNMEPSNGTWMTSLPSDVGNELTIVYNRVSYADRADTASKFQTARTINGTSFDGSSNIVTSYWGTSRNITIGNTTKSVNGSGNISWTLSEIGVYSYESLKNPNPIKFRNINGNSVSYDGSSTIDLTAGTYIAKLPYGFNSWSSGCTWGNTTGTSFASWNDSTGGSIDFRRDNPSSGKMSIKVDGRVYVNEGYNPVLSSEYNNGFWGMRTPDGGNNWIRTPNNGLIPYVSGGAGSGHSSLGTSSWYFSTAYIDKVYGSLVGTASNADTLDGAHLNGIFTAFGNNGHNITATIGGVTKQFVPNWAADSDKLDGYHVNNGNTWNSIPVIKSDGVMEVGKYIDFHYNTTNYDYSTRLQVQGNYSNVVNLPTASGTLALTSDLPMKYYAQYHMNPDGTIYSKHGNADFINSSRKSGTGHFYIALKSSVASYNTFIWGSGYCVSTVSSASGTNTNTSLSVTIARTYDYGFYVNTAQGSTKVDAHYYLYFLYFS